MENWKPSALATWATASVLALGYIWSLHQRLDHQQDLKDQVVELQRQREQDEAFTQFIVNVCTEQLFPNDPVK